MGPLAGKKIILGVTGSIAAYKAAMLTRLLVKAGAEVQPVLTAAAAEFITPLTMATLAKRPALSTFTTGPDGTWNNHVELGLWADLMLVAPASAHTLGKAANGLCDNLLLATYLSARCPVVFCPAMDLDMWAHPSTQGNLQRLLGYGNYIIEPGSGELASGLEGKGRMAEPEEIVTWVENHFAVKQDLLGKRVLITAGPTYEPLDPVRYIGNHSSGKMGYALAEAAAARGAHVTLVSGPSALNAVHPDIDLQRVTTARQMLAASQAVFAESDIVIFAAAVADYAPVHIADKKIKKEGPKAETLTLELVANPDIAATLGAQKRPGQRLMGFALETDEGPKYALRKLVAKNLDLVVLNIANEPGAGFQTDTNRVSVYGHGDTQFHFDLKPKAALAHDLLDCLMQLKQPAHVQ